MDYEGELGLSDIILDENLIVYSIDNEDDVVEVGPRLITHQDMPLMMIDLHLKVAKCRRCQKFERFKLYNTGPHSGEMTILDFNRFVDHLRIIHDSRHLDCERPICLN